MGSDPDTDIALIKVSSAQPFPVAPLGDSDGLRVGEWVCAIGNPLAYEHTVTVGVVSYIGRKLFDNSLDNYIQTDAAINFGNSGGPLINARGEVIGINAAISSRASNIGFAVPVNQARAVLPQLKARGRVARGFIGVALQGRRSRFAAVAGTGRHARRAGAGCDGELARRPRRAAALRPDHGRRRAAGDVQRRVDPAHRGDRAGYGRQRRSPARRTADAPAGEAGRTARPGRRAR